MVGSMVSSGTHSGKPPKSGDALHHAGEGMRERGDYPGFVQMVSLYTNASMHPVLTGVAAVAAGIGIAALMRAR